jgi:hypothetical protein
MARAIGPATATSANLKVMVGPWRMPWAPIFIGLSCSPVSDQSAMARGNSTQCLASARDCDPDPT